MKGESGKERTIETPEEFEALCNEYFTDSKESGELITITGLAIHLGFASRQSIYDYQKLDGFEFVASRARLMVEHSYELGLRGQNPTGSIFGLKNFGWSDKQSIELSEKVQDSGENEW